VILTLFLFSFALPAQTIIEQKLKIKGDMYQIPAILTLPKLAMNNSFPIVVMLHGTASNKDEVGGLFKRMANQLAYQNIASIRFDFAGSGESAVDYSQYDLKSAVNDAISVYKFINQQKNIEHSNIHLLGFSQGGLIAQLVAVHPELPVASMVTWSTVVGNGVSSFKPFFEQYEQEAKDNGFAAVKFPWLPKKLNFSHTWFEQVRSNTTLTQMSQYKGALLLVAAADDHVVPWQSSVTLLETAEQSKASLYLIKNANHVFNVLANDGERLNEDQSIPNELIHVTSHYFKQQVAINQTSIALESEPIN
jgi:dienelactone hydrolase